MQLSVARKMQVCRTDSSTSTVLALPHYLLEDIFNRLSLENASHIASAACVCKVFRDAGTRVRSVRLICLDRYHESIRTGITLSTNQNSKGAVSLAGTSNALETNLGLQQQASGGTSSSSGDKSEPGSRLSGDEKPPKKLFVFRNAVIEFLMERPFLLQMRIEIEAKLQSKSVAEGERRRTDFWMSDPIHVARWVPSVRATLQHLCIVDYGQQAIMRRTSILKILSQNCKALKTLDLRNMFIDSTDLEAMPAMRSFTLRCVKVTADTLHLLNVHMRNLTTLVLLGVFGATHGHLDFPSMKVLCLGLSTIAKVVTLHLPSLEKLQLKMLCPEALTVTATELKFMAFNLEVRDASKVDLRSLTNLQELLYGTSSFDILADLVATNVDLQTLFLDIPCMELGEDGQWLGVLKGVPLNLPKFDKLAQCCQRLGILNIGPGLWHAMEVNVTGEVAEKWPPFKRLILHMIPQHLERCIATLRGALLKPSTLLGSLEIHVHTNSPVGYETIVAEVAQLVAQLGRDCSFKPRRWTKSLDFSCFSF